MDIRIRCPKCRSKLVVGEDLVGRDVLCEDCDTQFTVEAPDDRPGERDERPSERDEREQPADPEPRSRRRQKDADENDDRPRSRDDFDDEGDRPIRRRPKRSSSHVAPLIFGSLLVVMTLLVGVGLFFAFGFGTSRDTTNYAKPAVAQPMNNNRPFRR